MIFKALKKAFPYTVPVLLGYLVLGIAFGLLLCSQGYPFYIALLMSIFIYAGSMQFVTVNLLTGGTTLLGAAVITLSVNARHLFYGLSMLEKFKGMKKKKPYMVFALSDETYSLLCGLTPPENIDRAWFFFFIALLNQCYWIAGTLIGALFGSLIRINTEGMDFAMTALFVVIFTEQWEKAENHLPALVGAAVTFLCLLIFGSENFILFSMAGILITLTLCRKKLEVNAHADN